MKMIQSKSKKLISVVAMLFMVLFGIMANGCGGGGGGDSYTPPPTVEAPGVPENFQITDSTGQGMVALTLTWDPPTTGGEPTTYEIYRSDTNVSVFQPANHYYTVQATDPLEFFESFMMEDKVASYWVVAAKNAGGETPSQVEAYTPMGGDEGFGNNFAAAMIFADGIGIGGDTITKTWTKTIADIDYATGLRPLSTEVLPVDTLPYLNTDPNMIYELDGVTYYKQQTASTWQGQWENGVNEDQNVTAKWGDNLISQTNLTVNSVVRIEMVLTKALDKNMTTYNMESLYGSNRYEVYGTDGNESNVSTAFVFAANAHLTIQQVDEFGNPIGDPVEDQPLFSDIQDGPGKFAAEINVAGNLTYGYVWDLKGAHEPGRYRITFSLDEESLKGTPNNTYIEKVVNGTRVDGSTVFIEINIGQ